MRTHGQCACGAVRFHADGPAKWMGHCHCHNCRAAHGAAFVTWVTFADDAFAFDAGAEQLTAFATPAGSVRSFCRACGTTLFWDSPKDPEHVHVVRAALDDNVEGEPMAHIYADRQVSWIALHDDLPRLGGEHGGTPLEFAPCL